MTIFADRVLRWFERYGRKDLPWQQDATPYRVWVSEIMLQQTQVVTAIPYYERFMQRFPDVLALANASEDDVLARWSGLGYYARARNLHWAARIVRDQFAGVFPEAFDAVVSLPGIGRSTAGAILSLARGQPHAILDGNVKRVLARHRGIEGWPGQTSVMNALWAAAEDALPASRAGEYNQAMMDLGATLCVRTKPDCSRCPVCEDCVARNESCQDMLPGKRKRAALPERHTEMLIIEHAGRVLLQRRPSAGIWGGLWSLPEAEDAQRWRLLLAMEQVERAELTPLAHTFSHFRLHIRPFHLHLTKAPDMVGDSESGWYDAAAPGVGLPAPVRKILAQLVARTAERE